MAGNAVLDHALAAGDGETDIVAGPGQICVRGWSDSAEGHDNWCDAIGASGENRLAVIVSAMAAGVKTVNEMDVVVSNVQNMS